MQRSFRKDMTALSEIFFYLEQSLAPHQASAATVYTLSLAVEELFTNMVKYSSPGAGVVLISISTEGGVCKVAIEECGVAPFDPTLPREIDLVKHAESGRQGGLGLHLVRRLVNDLQYEYRRNCNLITFTKDLES